MVVVILGNGVAFLAGAGELYIIAQTSAWLAIALQWSVLIRGRKQDNILRTAREIKEFSDLLHTPHTFKHYAYMHPVRRGWIRRWYDKWKGITYVHLWTYDYELGEGKINEFESTIKFPVTNKQLFEMNLKGYIDMTEPKNVVRALEYIGNELCARVLAGPEETD